MSRDSELLENIGQIAAKVAPAGWLTLWLECEAWDGAGKTLFDWADATGTRAWFVPDMQDQYKIWQAFDELRTAMAALPPHSKWSKALFTLESGGKFTMQYEYPNQ